jgi:phage repressor protein C with HTH and peptisase S24 domain
MKRRREPRAELARLIADRREDYAGLSRMLGRNAAYLQQYIKRGVPKKLTEEDRRKLALYFGVEESLLGGPAQSKSADGIIAVPLFDIQASAGPGAFTGMESPVARLGFDETFLQHLSAARSSDLSIIRVCGDSMFPTLADGDDIMVDRSPGAKVRDGIYVLRRDGTLSVKRIAVHPGSGKLTISSDNPAYPTWPECDRAEVDVIGRVIWTGRRMS